MAEEKESNSKQTPLGCRDRARVVGKLEDCLEAKPGNKQKNSRPIGVQDVFEQYVSKTEAGEDEKSSQNDQHHAGLDQRPHEEDRYFLQTQKK